MLSSIHGAKCVFESDLMTKKYESLFVLFFKLDGGDEYRLMSAAMLKIIITIFKMYRGEIVRHCKLNGEVGERVRERREIMRDMSVNSYKLT